MIRFDNRFDEYSYRIAFREADASILTADLEEGTWVTVVGSKVKVADGTQKSFLTISSKRAGRDQITGVPVKKISYLHGTFELTTTIFDPAGTYGDMVPLVVTTGGVLTPFAPLTDSPWLIVAYAIGTPVNGELRICSAY